MAKRESSLEITNVALISHGNLVFLSSGPTFTIKENDSVDIKMHISGIDVTIEQLEIERQVKERIKISGT